MAKVIFFIFLLIVNVWAAKNLREKGPGILAVTRRPSRKPTEAPLPDTDAPTLNPTELPTPDPTPDPSAAPTFNPTAQPTPEPSAAPTYNPTAQPTPEPSAAPTFNPTAAPTPEPSAAPTFNPTAAPTPEPSAAPTFNPTAAPTPEPSAAPTFNPTAAPTPEPSAEPTFNPTAAPTPEPSAEPTFNPTAAPTVEPSAGPTFSPTAAPTPEPSAEPTFNPTAAPTVEPSAGPTFSPTAHPTPEPSAEPTQGLVPSMKPTRSPSFKPPGSCGAQYGGTCVRGMCCSQWGFCGTTELYCGPGCQSDYGYCNVAPTLLPTAGPLAPSTPKPTAPTMKPSPRPTTTKCPHRRRHHHHPPHRPGFINDIASWNVFQAFPQCCPNLPNYNASYPSTECTENPNICAEAGFFRGIGRRSLDFVKKNALVRFYDDDYWDEDSFAVLYADRYVSINATCNGTSVSFQAMIVDTCQTNCSSKVNPRSGYFLEIEYYTMLAYFGTTDCSFSATTVGVTFGTFTPRAIPQCGPDADDNQCYRAIDCCSQDGYCGVGFGYCLGF